MNKQDAAKLLSLIKLSYPTAYRDIDKDTASATVTMWQMSFPEVPYPVMEQAFNHFRMISKFPPTVAEMVTELRGVHYQAADCVLIHKALGNEEGVRQYRAIMECTARYTDESKLGGLGSSILPRLNGGGYDAAAPGNRLDREDRLPFPDAGRGSP